MLKILKILWLGKMKYIGKEKLGLTGDERKDMGRGWKSLGSLA